MNVWPSYAFKKYKNRRSNTFLLYTWNRSIQKSWQKEVDMLEVIIDYLMQIFNPLGKITTFWAKIFSTNTSNNQTVLKNIEYLCFCCKNKCRGLQPLHVIVLTS